MVLSDHQKFKINSPEMNEYMKNAFEELKAFHIFSVQNDVEYSIRSGSALGYLIIKTYLPWDDDIDISYSKDCYEKIISLYNSGELLENQWKDNNWEFKSIILNNKNYYMLKFKDNLWFKLIKNNGQVIKKQRDLGGLDIFPQAIPLYELKFDSKPIKINFAGIETMLVYDKQHIDELIRVYGHATSWGKHLNDAEKITRTENLKKLFSDFKIMNTIITFGTFDLLHIGHINILEKCKKMGDNVIVGISTDKFSYEKKQRYPIYSENERKKIIESLKFVDNVFFEESLELKRDYILKYKANTLVMGMDWKDKFDEFNDICKVIYLDRTPSVSTTHLIETIQSD